MAAPNLNPQAEPFVSNASDNLKSRIESDLKGSIAGDIQSLNNFVELNTYFFRKLKVLETQIFTLSEKQNHSLLPRISELERQLQMVTSENISLKQHLALVEDSTKIMYLRVEGLSEIHDQNLILYVATTLSKTGVSCTADDLDYVRRIGKQRTGFTRPILVKFNRESKRNMILYNRANLHKSNSPAALVWLNDDVSDCTRRNRKAVRDIATLAKQSGFQEEIKIHGDGLVLGTNKIKHKDLDLLPEAISLEKAKTRRDHDDLYFQGENSPLSNFYPCRIEDNDHSIFSSAEQLFQYKKAIHANFRLTAAKIKLTFDPYEVKRLGNLVPTPDSWKALEIDLMSDILLKKYTQNPALGDRLLNTGNLNLHEASNDLQWATGAELSSKAVLSGTWPGLDTMGQLLEGVRSELSRLFGINTSDLSGQSYTPPPTQDSAHDELSPLNDDEEPAPPHPPSDTDQNIPNTDPPNDSDQTTPKLDNPPPAPPSNRKMNSSPPPLNTSSLPPPTLHL